MSNHTILNTAVFDPVLRILGMCYAWAVRAVINRRMKAAVELQVPVISVGNISMGGTGKTPVSLFLARKIADQGKKPVILSRGYKARPGKLPHLVKPGDDPRVCGDEPLHLARSLAGLAQVVVDPDRVLGAMWALENLQPDLFILDDGFQHVRIKRDRNLVLITPDDLEHGWNKVFPHGRWREDEQALDRADVFLVNLWGRNVSEIKSLVAGKHFLGQRIVYYFDITIAGLEKLDSKLQVLTLNKRPYILVTGLANPGKVVTSIHTFLGYPPVSHLRFPDHHSFGPESIKAILALAKEAGVSDVVCTPKDAVKITPATGVDIWQMQPEVRFMDDMEDRFVNRLF